MKHLVRFIQIRMVLRTAKALQIEQFTVLWVYIGFQLNNELHSGKVGYILSQTTNGLTLSQMTIFELIQTERVCRQQF